MTVERKTLTKVSVKDADAGTVEAVFATLNVIDHDGDVILPGAFQSGQKVRISAYNHASWGPAMLPVGKGTITEEGDEAIFRGQFFMDTQVGADTFRTVKNLDDLGEWSFGFDLKQGSTREGEHNGEQARFIGPLPDGTAGIVTHEVSPVMLGAGIGTRTLAAKGFASDLDAILKEVKEGRELSTANVNRLANIAKTLRESGDEIDDLVSRNTRDDGKQDDQPQMKLTDHLDAVKTGDEAIIERVREVVTLRTEQGKQLGQESRDAAETLADTWESCAKALRDVVTSADATDNGDNSLTEAEAAAIDAELTLISATSTQEA